MLSVFYERSVSDMKRKRKRTSNSDTLETTNKSLGQLPRDYDSDIVNVDSCTEEKQAGAFETMEAPGNEREIHFWDLCTPESNDCFRGIFVNERLESTANRILTGIARKQKSYIMLLGEEGTGKKTAVQYVAGKIVSKDCPTMFVEQKTAIYELIPSEIPVDIEEAVWYFNQILTYASTQEVQNVVLYCPDITRVCDLFTCNYDILDREILKEPFLRVKFILVFNDGKYINQDESAELVNFTNSQCVVTTVVSEDDPLKILDILSSRITELEKAHNVVMPYEMQKYLMMIHYALSFIKGDINYRIFLSVVDGVLSIAEIEGASEVTRYHVEWHYRQYFTAMESVSKGYIIRMAVHESGHILLALAIPEFYKWYRLVGCSLVSDCKTGTEAMTCLKKEIYSSRNELEQIRYAACILAGRAAEIEILDGYSYKYSGLRKCLNANNGSNSDVQDATEKIRNWVLHSGVYASLGFNVDLNDYDCLEPSTKRKVDKIVARLIRKAYKIANNVVRENHAFIEAMAGFLVENNVATREDINNIRFSVGINDNIKMFL